MRRKRLKRYILIIFTLAAIALAGAAHIASIIVPVKFQKVLLGEFESAIGKRILIQSIRFNIFKGLILDGVVIYDKTMVFARAKEISAYIIFSELLNKKIFIPFIRIEGPQITMERSSDGTFNLSNLIRKGYVPPEDLDLIMRRLVIRHGRITFVDHSASLMIDPELSRGVDRKFDPVFKKDIEDFNADIKFNLPSKVAYKFSFDIAGKPVMLFSAQGEYLIPEKRSRLTVDLKNISPSIFGPYTGSRAFRLQGGIIDADITFDFIPEEKVILLTALARDIAISKERSRAIIKAVIKADMRYTAAGGGWVYSGSADVSSMDIEGIEGVGAIEKAKGVFRFDNTRLWCDGLDADLFGIPWKVRVNIANFASPIIDIYASFDGKLGAFQETICESCRTRLPVEFAGDASIKIGVTLEKDKPVKMNGNAALRDVTMRLGSGLYPVEHITGEVNFTPQKLEWSELVLAYRDIGFKTSGAVTNFSLPKVELKARSRELFLDAAFNMDGTEIALSRLKGRYLDSSFSMVGNLDIKDPAGTVADVRGSLDLDLKDLYRAMKNSPGIRKMKPAGRLKAEFSLAGNTSHFFDCTFHTKAKAKSMSLYGVRLSEAAIDYAQLTGMGEVKKFNAECYGGDVSASGRINWRAKAQPYAFSVKAEDIMLESIKADTGFKDAVVSGDIKAYINLNGYFKDVTRLSAVGRLTITDGNLWELNLFKGLGRSIFTSDFSSIVFSEGSCDFKIADQVFFADGIDLKGDLMRLSGSGMIGFDRTIDGVLRPEINENAMWPGTQRSIAMAVQRGTAIEIKGTLKDPQFRTRTDILTVVGGVAGALLSQE